MSDHVYKQIELTGSSTEGIEQAIERAVNKAGESVNNMRWFEVTDIRGHIDAEKVNHWQVSVKIGFTISG